MSLEKERIAIEPTEKDQLVTKEKLPYVKPELHLLNLDGTDGKTSPSPSENTAKTINGTFKLAPS